MRRIGGSGENRGGFSVMSWTYGEEDEEALVLLPHTVVDPGTMVVHLTDAALTDAAEEEQQQHLFWVFWVFFFLPDWLKFCQCKQKYTQLFFFLHNIQHKIKLFFCQNELNYLTSESRSQSFRGKRSLTDQILWRKYSALSQSCHIITGHFTCRAGLDS